MILRSYSALYKVLVFCVFLIPYYTQIGGQGISINYTLLLAPMIFYWKPIKLKTEIFYIFFVYFAIFTIATVFQYSLLEYFDRRLGSFLIFSLFLIFCLIDINEGDIYCFKVAILLVGLYITSTEIYQYWVLNDGSLRLEELKAEVGSQREGFLILFSFWVLFQSGSKIIAKKLARTLVLIILVIGLLLTFSRASIISLLISLLLFFLVEYKLNLKNIVAAIFVAILCLSVLNYLVPEAITFFETKLFTIGTDAQVYNFVDKENSEGYRLFMWGQILEYVMSNPFTGSGFLGVWVLSDDLSGSAHNQYMDVLFRTGIFGFTLYLFLLYKVASSLVKYDKSLFYGFIGVLVYGCFHETFKLSHGAVILSFLFGVSYRLYLMRDKPTTVLVKQN